MAEAPTYRIVIRPLPDQSDPQGWRRLRALCKAALRGYAIRVCTFEAVTQDDIAAADEAERTGTEASV